MKIIQLDWIDSNLQNLRDQHFFSLLMNGQKKMAISTTRFSIANYKSEIKRSLNANAHFKYFGPGTAAMYRLYRLACIFIFCSIYCCCVDRCLFKLHASLLKKRWQNRFYSLFLYCTRFFVHVWRSCRIFYIEIMFTDFVHAWISRSHRK